MALTDLADGIEALGKFGRFWLFVGVSSYRARQWADFRAATVPGKALRVLEAMITAAVGLGLPALLVWLILD